MTDQLLRAMHSAVGDTLENMAFMDAYPDNAGLPMQENDWCTVSLLMHDPVPGEFRLLMPRDLLLQITEALYAEPVEELGEGLAKDTLAEILNTIAGKFLNEIIPGQVYRLGLPEIEEEGGGPIAEGIIRWSYKIDEHTLLVEFNGESLPADE